MAKIVIAGAADCPYFAKIELLADSLAKNLDHFKIHKIVKQPSEWESWLKDVCSQRGWKHHKSPLVWRELVDRGGKGILIGGANDFQEYAFGYYNVKSDFNSTDMKKIAQENLKTKTEMDEEDKYFRSLSKPVNVCITNAASPVCYNMVHAIASGNCLGSDTEVSLILCDTEDKLEELAGVRMEAFDLACPLLRKITVATDTRQAFKDCAAIVILDEIDQQEGESNDDWLRRNSRHFVNYAKVIDEVARPDVKVIVGGNGPVNFNAFMMLENCNTIPKQNVVALARMVENHAKAVIAERLSVNSADVVDVVVWGNPNGQHYLDVLRARVHRYDGAIWGPPSFSLPVVEMVADDKWLQTEYIDLVSKRREVVQGSLGHKATCSHAAAVASLLGHWCLGGPDGQVFSLGVLSDGSHYNIREGLVYSFPVRFSDGGWTVVDDIDLTEDQREQLNTTVQDLMVEKYATFPDLKPPTPSPPTPPPATEGQDQDQQSLGEENKKQFGQESDPQTTDETKSQAELDEEDKPSLEKITEDKEGEEKAMEELHVDKSGEGGEGKQGEQLTGEDQEVEQPQREGADSKGNR